MYPSYLLSASLLSAILHTDQTAFVLLLTNSVSHDKCELFTQCGSWILFHCWPQWCCQIFNIPSRLRVQWVPTEVVPEIKREFCILIGNYFLMFTFHLLLRGYSYGLKLRNAIHMYINDLKSQIAPKLTRMMNLKFSKSQSLRVRYSIRKHCISHMVVLWTYFADVTKTEALAASLSSLLTAASLLPVSFHSFPPSSSSAHSDCFVWRQTAVAG